MITVPDRSYDVALLGATGFTANFVAEYISRNFPPKLRWVVAGRDVEKLNALRARLKDLNPKGLLPEVQGVDIAKDSVDGFVQSTKVLINAIGPYSSHGAGTLAACAAFGTSYLDFCTETPWIEDMIRLHHKTAVRNRARIIPAIGNSSSPSAMTSFLLATQYKKMHGSPLHSIMSSYDMKINGMSSGSLSSVVEVVSRYGIGHLLVPDPYRLIPVRRDVKRPRGELYLGYKRDPILGHLSTSFAAAGNEAVVYRGQYLQKSPEAPGFTYQEFMPASSRLQAMSIHFFTKVAILLLGLRVFRALIDYLKPKAGTGPPSEVSRGEFIHIKAVGRRNHSPQTLQVEYSYQGSMYYHSALLAAEAAMVLIDLWDSPQQETGEEGQFGILSPSSLGMAFVERLKDAGVKIELLK